MSLTIAGLIVAFIGRISQQFGYEFKVSDQEVVTTVTVIMQVIGFVMAYVGRVRHNDVTWYGARKYDSVPTIDSSPDDLD